MPLFSRSARTLIQRQRGEPLHIKVLQTLGCAAMQDAIDIKVLQTLGMARDRPSPYGERGRFLSCSRSAGPLGCHTRIREGFPRALSTAAENARSPEATDVCCSARCMARDRPSPYGERGLFFTVARGPVPRDRCMARDRPSPYVKGWRFFHRSAGPVTATLSEL